MGIIAPMPNNIFDQDKAAELAAELNAKDEDGWIYTVVNNPDTNGPKTAIIKIYDEDGHFVGLL